MRLLCNVYPMLTNYQKSLIILNPIIYELYDMIVIDFSWQINATTCYEISN